jgi:hypothetical protein
MSRSRNEREFAESRERSKSHERRANESGQSAYMRKIESGGQEIRYTGQSLSHSDNKGFLMRSDYPRFTNQSQEFLKRETNTQPTSFRSRIEGLLPDRLKSQYEHLQGKTLDSINEESYNKRRSSVDMEGTSNTLDHYL